jgi:hypothetical protein
MTGACIALLFALVVTPILAAAEDSDKDQGKPPPLTVTFEKTATEDGPPYTLTLKNTSKAPLKARATVLLSVVAHNMDKAREVPEHEIGPDQTWTISELAAQDRVTVHVAGYAPLELVVK